MNIFEDHRPLYGQDPYVTMVDGLPILCESVDEERIVLSILDGLDRPQRIDSIVVWDHAAERQVWAPELHFMNDLWYIYYAASNGDNITHRNYVLQAPHYFGPYISLGKIGPDFWGIDLTQFSWWDGNRYAVWSGWENNGDEFPQNLYISKMNSPWNIRGRTRLSVPELEWEKSIAPILEGPQVYTEESKLSILYSANASWKQEYSTGMLTLVGSDPLDPGSWEKKNEPLIQNAGHGCIVEDRFIFARKLSAFPGWTDREIVSIPSLTIFGQAAQDK